MTEMHTRYPGAQPFPDTALSRRTFFGREQSSIALTDQILANRLVVVYAKSGLGKTSLLNAGVAPRLREAARLPLFVRVNDIRRGPLTSVLEAIRAEAERQQVEYVHGESGSLWSFFKTVEFWRKDLLLTPVLICDQFEELFTLQPDQAREMFLAELGSLVRGVPPSSLPQGDSGVSNVPPSVHVVLSLREDFLGTLEEGADYIPQIMDHRFRLMPLSCEAAVEAITGPAAIADPGFTTQPFRLQPEFVTTIVNYLAKSTGQVRNPSSRYVEPFQLQLSCRRVEQIAALKQKTSSNEIVLSLTDIGGEAALAQTLASFYADAIRSVPEKHLRPVVRRLCEQFLISPEGRRLSLEERELQRQLGVPAATLRQLVERRLLRTDRRSDSTYYELSHDALVEPILASRRTQALVVGWAETVAGSIISFVMVAALILLVLAAVGVVTHRTDTKVESESGFVFAVVLFLIVPALVIPFSLRLLRTGIRTRERYRRRITGEFAPALPAVRPRKERLPAWLTLGAGSILVVWLLFSLGDLAVITCLFVAQGNVPNWAKDKFLEQALLRWPLVEIPWDVIELCTIGLCGWLLLRQGCRTLWPHKMISARPKASPVPGLDEPKSLRSAFLKAVSGTVAFVAAALGVFIVRQCIAVSPESVPAGLSRALMLSDFAGTCEKGGRHWSMDLMMFLFSAVVLSMVLLRSGVLDVCGVLRHRRMRGRA
jgi:hypothetical protein